MSGVETDTATWRRHKQRHVVSRAEEAPTPSENDAAAVAVFLQAVLDDHAVDTGAAEDNTVPPAELAARIFHNTKLLSLLARKELVGLARLNSVSPTESTAFIVESLACVLDIRAAHVLGKEPFWDSSLEHTGPTLLWPQFQEKYKDEAVGIIELLQSFYDYAFDAFAGAIARISAAKTAQLGAAKTAQPQADRTLLEPDLLELTGLFSSDDDGDLYWGPC
jgi:hypothetical protein